MKMKFFTSVHLASRLQNLPVSLGNWMTHCATMLASCVFLLVLCNLFVGFYVFMASFYVFMASLITLMIQRSIIYKCALTNQLLASVIYAASQKNKTPNS